MVSRRKGTQPSWEQNKDEQTISDSSLIKLVVAEDNCNLEEMGPPSTVMCDLGAYRNKFSTGYQNQERNWCWGSSKNSSSCWVAYRICDKYVVSHMPGVCRWPCDHTMCTQDVQGMSPLKLVNANNWSMYNLSNTAKGNWPHNMPNREQVLGWCWEELGGVFQRFKAPGMLGTYS